MTIDHSRDDSYIYIQYTQILTSSVNMILSVTKRDNCMHITKMTHEACKIRENGCISVSTEN